jgi:hypothetical protein
MAKDLPMDEEWLECMNWMFDSPRGLHIMEDAEGELALMPAFDIQQR